MKQEKQNKRIYRAPAMTVVELECETILAMSGQGTDTNGNHKFGVRSANERRGQWGDLWAK